MISYRDMTFCMHHGECADGNHCPRALTDEVKKQAQMWWGGEDAPVSVFINKPWCFDPKQPTFEEN